MFSAGGEHGAQKDRGVGRTLHIVEVVVERERNEEEQLEDSVKDGLMSLLAHHAHCLLCELGVVLAMPGARETTLAAGGFSSPLFPATELS